MVHLLLKPGLENFERYFTSVWDECNCAVVWAFLTLLFFGIGMKTDLFQSCAYCWICKICWHIECSTFTTSSFRIWNSSTGTPSPPLALFVVCFLRPTWLCIPGCLALGEWSYYSDYLGCEDRFCIVLLCILATSFNRWPANPLQVLSSRLAERMTKIINLSWRFCKYSYTFKITCRNKKHI